MRKDWWIALSVILLVFNIFLSIGVKHYKNLSTKGLPLELSGREKSPFPKESLLTLIIYFSENSCEACMGEAFYWNKLFLDLTREELSVLGFTDEKELKDKIKNKYQVLFPIIYDRNEIIKRRFNVDSGPFRIILDSKGGILYFSPAFSEKSVQENFYFEVVELLTKVRIRNFMKTKK
jgi:peroxiredoxin